MIDNREVFLLVFSILQALREASQATGSVFASPDVHHFWTQPEVIGCCKDSFDLLDDCNLRLKPFPTGCGKQLVIKAVSSAVQDSGFGTQGLSTNVLVRVSCFLLKPTQCFNGFSLLPSINLKKWLKLLRGTQEMLL